MPNIKSVNDKGQDLGGSNLSLIHISRSRGSIVAFETGDAIAYGLFNAQDKGQLFIGAGVPV